MKKVISWLLLFSAVLSLVATVSVKTSAGEAEEPEGSLFLKVSSITFSLVGEREDVYLGLIPRELVTWESEDPSIVSVENGVLTAVGVGSTVIRATHADRIVECTAGCLAKTQEELDSLPYEVVSAPKRLPPEVDLEEPCTSFDNAAIVGDSITYYLFQWESKTNYLGDILFLARGGVSMNGFVRRFKNIYYRGNERYLEDAIGESGVDRVYFLMGSNDISSTTQRPYYFQNWDTMLERIREKNPDIEIVIISNIPLYDETRESTQDDKRIKEHNDLIAEYNEKLRQYAGENGCMFLDLNYYVQDHYGRMPEIYNQGSYHMNQAGCLNWMKILRFYADYELEGGTLS